MAEELVEAAIEGAEMPAVEARAAEPAVGFEPHIVERAEPAEAPVQARIEEPLPAPVSPESAEAEAMVEAAVESAEIPAAEPEPAVAPKRARASRAKTAPKSEPVLVDVHAITDKPEAPRRGWWQRLTQP
jgi:hypothetical protein